MRDLAATQTTKSLLAILLVLMALAGLGCVPGATGPFLSPPTAPVNRSDVRPVRVRKMGGDITLAATPSGAELLTMGGNISIEHATGFVAASTMGGDIDIDTLDAGTKLVSNGGNARIFLRARGESAEPRDIDITVRGGNVRLMIAEPVSAKFEVELGYQRNQADRYAIKSDFPLTQTTSEWHRAPGHLFQEHQRIRGTGVVGEGVDRIRIHVEGGMIYLTRKN
jgi:hypothetical protein